MTEICNVLSIKPDSGWSIDSIIHEDDKFHNEEILMVKLIKEKKSQKSGTWEWKSDGYMMNWYECSNCHHRFYMGDPRPYCSECGSKNAKTTEIYDECDPYE